jgi:hypothetical protein
MTSQPDQNQEKTVLAVFVNGQKITSISATELPCEKKPALELAANSTIDFVDSQDNHFTHAMGPAAGWFHFSIRVHQNLGCQADCAITESEHYDPSNFPTGIRFQPFFLSGAATSNDIFSGHGLFKRGLHFSGRVTNGSIMLSCLCDHCGKSFLIKSYHVGFTEAGYFYSDSGMYTLSVSTDVPGSPAALETPDPVQLAALEARLPKAPDGTSFRYLNPFRCPHCKQAYIDFQEHPEERVAEYYGNYFADGRLLIYDPAKP